MNANNNEITILYFASLSEDLHCKEEFFTLPTTDFTLEQLIAQLSLRDDNWAEKLDNNSVHHAVNHTICDRNKKLNAGDEVAFFPPVTGG